MSQYIYLIIGNYMLKIKKSFILFQKSNLRILCTALKFGTSLRISKGVSQRFVLVMFWFTVCVEVGGGGYSTVLNTGKKLLQVNTSLL